MRFKAGSTSCAWTGTGSSAATTANKQICLANIHHYSYFALSQIDKAAQGLNIGENEIRARNGSVESYLVPFHREDDGFF
jgi:hypothetical protein